MSARERAAALGERVGWRLDAGLARVGWSCPRLHRWLLARAAARQPEPVVRPVEEVRDERGRL